MDQPLEKSDLPEIGNEIKQRIRDEVGEYISVSIGIGPNRFLAKTAAGLHKPDGLDMITKDNAVEVYRALTLPDLHGINVRNIARLNRVGIFTVEAFYSANYTQLRSAFQSILAYYWYLRLRGWEIDNFKTTRRTFSHSYVLHHPVQRFEDIAPIFQKLVERAGTRMRRHEYATRGIHVSVLYEDRYKNRYYWHLGKKLHKVLFDSHDMYKESVRILLKSPHKDSVRKLAVTFFALEKMHHTQLELFEDVDKKKSFVDAVDTINDRWGNLTITPARMLNTQEKAPDTIAFGGVKELTDVSKLQRS